ncbi:MAG: molybdate ABC transporter substrate-binding protein [Dehalococcoidia bacterium]
MRRPRYRLAAWALVTSLAVLALAACGDQAAPSTGAPASGGTLELFVGSATKPATEEVVQLFEDRYGVRVDLHFGGSGAMLSQMKLTERGDIYFPGSSDFMEEAKRRGLVLPQTERRVVYLIPAINVQKGNPEDIQSLEDLARPGLKVAIADPETVCVGLYALEVLEKSGLAEAVRPNIATYTESCAKTARVVALKNVDAVIGWRVFQYWSPEEIETVYLSPDQVPRIGYVPIAISTFSKQPELAQQFIDFVTSDEAGAIYGKWHYLTTVEEAREFAPEAEVGGEWELPEGWP